MIPLEQSTNPDSEDEERQVDLVIRNNKLLARNLVRQGINHASFKKQTSDKLIDINKKTAEAKIKIEEYEKQINDFDKERENFL